MKKLDKELYLKYLKEQDDPENFEFPGWWYGQGYEKWKILRADFEHLVDQINKSFWVQCDFSSISAVQDASYIWDITIPWICIKNKTRDLYMRVSHFGRFVSFTDSWPDTLEKTEDLISSDNLRKLLSILRLEKYVLIPIEILSLPYTWKHKDTKNWIFRYFFYS
jgi:hypothetical protein